MNKRSFLAAAAAALTIFTTSSFASDPVLKAGMDAAYPPFGSQDRKTREYVGYDVDIIRAIAKHAGFKVVVRNLAFDGLIPALKTGAIDIAINDIPTNDYYVAKAGKGYVKSLPVALSTEDLGIAVKKGNTELLNRINAGLTTIKKNGEFRRIYKKWFGHEPTSELLKD